MRKPHGTIQQRGDSSRILLTRTVPVAPARLWETFTDPAALAAWIGVLRTDPDTGIRTFSMLEGGHESEPETLEISRCRAPHELEYTTTNESGGWSMGLVIRAVEGGSEIDFHQVLREQDDPRNMGPGWEYYLERAIEFTLGVDPDSVRWEDFHPALADAYCPTPGKQ